FRPSCVLSKGERPIHAAPVPVHLMRTVFMLIKKFADIPSSEITPRRLYLNRRKFIAGAALAGAAAATGLGFREFASPSMTAQANAKIDGVKKSSFSTNETIT